VNLSDNEASELVVGNMAGEDAEIGEHSIAGLDHQGRAAEIIFDGLWIGVPAEIFLQHDLVDEAQMAGPIVLGQGRGKREVESKVTVNTR